MRKKIQLNKPVQIKIGDKIIIAKEDQTILEAAKENGIDIPALCYHPDLDIKANCRLCGVEIKGEEGITMSCERKVSEGMTVITDSEKIRKVRKTNLELIFSQHREECNDCVWHFNCVLLDLAAKFGVDINKFKDRKSGYPTYNFGPAIVFDSSKCIDCRNCIDICHKQGIDYLELEEKDGFFEVKPTKNKDIDCIYCGQCLVRCPAGAFEGVGEFEQVENPLSDPSKIVIFQFAPSIRTSIGEEFKMPAGSIVTGQLVSAIRKLGANKVFDVSVGADFTTIEEAKELMARMKAKKRLPMFTSCCPAWVKYVEFFKSELIPNLTSARSPHIVLGGLIKTYWAEKNNIDPNNIIVVSILPCTAKKYEITREELKINGMKPVDYALTTRELAILMHRRKIDIKNMAEEALDNPLGFASGAGVIYGATGGVVESALRTVYKEIVGRDLESFDFSEARGMSGVKTAKIKIKNLNVKVAITNGMDNAKKILEELEKNPKRYDYIEVMACPGGCIGGGGQPMPTDPETRRKRAEALYQIDKGKKNRTAHDNPVVKEVYGYLNEKEDLKHQIFHTSYKKDKK